jgi:ankyrin repeat protein
MKKRIMIIACGIALILASAIVIRPSIVRAFLYEAMFDAVRDNQPKLVRLLLLLGADPDGASDYAASSSYQGLEFSSHIHTAVMHRDCAVLNILLGARPNLNIAIADGATPLSCAIHDHNRQAVKALLDAGANAHYNSTWTAAHQARSLGFDDLLPVIEPHLRKTP